MTGTKQVPCTICGEPVTVRKGAHHGRHPECAKRYDQERNRVRYGYSGWRVNKTPDNPFVIVECPGDWTPGAEFDKLNFEETLKLGFFPVGTIFTYKSKRLVVCRDKGRYTFRQIGVEK